MNLWDIPPMNVRRNFSTKVVNLLYSAVHCVVLWLNNDISKRVIFRVFICQFLMKKHSFTTMSKDHNSICYFWVEIIYLCNQALVGCLLSCSCVSQYTTIVDEVDQLRSHACRIYMEIVDCRVNLETRKCNQI